MEEWQELVEGKGDNDGVELEYGTEPDAVDIFSPTCPRREDLDSRAVTSPQKPFKLPGKECCYPPKRQLGTKAKPV